MASIEPEVLSALQRWAATYGRTWKTKLLDFWASGKDCDYWAQTDQDWAGLRRARNTLGPSGLKKFRLPAQ